MEQLNISSPRAEVAAVSCPNSSIPPYGLTFYCIVLYLLQVEWKWKKDEQDVESLLEAEGIMQGVTTEREELQPTSGRGVQVMRGGVASSNKYPRVAAAHRAEQRMPAINKPAQAGRSINAHTARAQKYLEFITLARNSGGN